MPYTIHFGLNHAAPAAAFPVPQSTNAATLTFTQLPMTPAAPYCGALTDHLKLRLRDTDTVVNKHMVEMTVTENKRDRRHAQLTRRLLKRGGPLAVTARQVLLTAQLLDQARPAHHASIRPEYVNGAVYAISRAETTQAADSERAQRALKLKLRSLEMLLNLVRHDAEANAPMQSSAAPLTVHGTRYWTQPLQDYWELGNAADGLLNCLSNLAKEDCAPGNEQPGYSPYPHSPFEVYLYTVYKEESPGVWHIYAVVSSNIISVHPETGQHYNAQQRQVSQFRTKFNRIIGVVNNKTHGGQSEDIRASLRAEERALCRQVLRHFQLLLHTQLPEGAIKGTSDLT